MVENLADRKHKRPAFVFLRYNQVDSFLFRSSASLCQRAMGDQRTDIEFEVVSDTSPTGTTDNLDEDGPADSRLPLTGVEKRDTTSAAVKDPFKDNLSFALSVFNLMNAILGSGILGLGEAIKNLGMVPFFGLLMLTSLLAGYTISMLLHLSKITGLKSYEGLAHKSFGIQGKLVTSVVIVLHCLGAMCSYMFIVKTELPEVVKVFTNNHPAEGEEPIYMNGNFLMFLVVLLVITPLASMKDIKFLGYSSAFGMSCMLLFTFTVVVRKFSIPCPIPDSGYSNVSSTMHHDDHMNDTAEEEQYCEPKAFNLNTRSAYAVPTMFFSFMCHASMLPIYAELRRPTVKRMQKVAAVSIFNVLSLYILSATFGYLTFFNRVKSELLLTYSLYNPTDTLIIISRVMVIICVTLSVPLLHYPARKTVIITFFKDSLTFSWIRHIGVMVGLLTLAVIFVLFVPNIRDIFGIAGATTSASLLVIFPSVFFIRLTGESASDKVRRDYSGRRVVAWVLAAVGIIFCFLSIALIIVDWLS